MKPYAKTNREFKVQPEGAWTEIYSITLDVWMRWLKGEQAKYIDSELLTLILRLNVLSFLVPTQEELRSQKVILTLS